MDHNIRTVYIGLQNPREDIDILLNFDPYYLVLYISQAIFTNFIIGDFIAGITLVTTLRESHSPFLTL